MSNIQSKSHSKPAHRSSMFPMDMSWGHMDKMFNQLRQSWPFHGVNEQPFQFKDLALNPDVDIKEDKNSYQISAELPGLDAKDITVDLTDNVLTISGEKKSESEDKKDEDYHVMERRYGYFKRSFSLPFSVKQEEVKADFKKGVLHVTLPKSEKATNNQHQIPINE